MLQQTSRQSEVSYFVILLYYFIFILFLFYFCFLFAGRSNRKITESTVIDKKILDIIW